MSAVSCQSNSTAVCRVVHYIETEAPELQLIECVLLRDTTNISSKADRGDIFIVHDQKSPYRTPLHVVFIIIYIFKRDLNYIHYIQCLTNDVRFVPLLL